MTIAGTHLGIPGRANANEAVPRELAALSRATEWINSPPLTASTLAGKVVLVDFWTYTCINWLRTLPYVRAWADKYKERLIVVGVHTPEFPFEHDLENVRRAVRQMKIEYPIAVDNDYAIWRAFDNHYWPALYLIDAQGKIRHHQFGEGDYERSEIAIQRSLAQAGVTGFSDRVVAVDPVGIEVAADWKNLRSPENYLGSDRTQNFSTSAQRLALNEWALTGDWAKGRQAIVAKMPGARLVNRFHARDLHLVMGPPRRESPVRFRVSIDGQAPGAAHGADVDADGNGTVVDQRLYQLIRQPQPIVDRRFEIEFLDAGAEAFAFTFG